jgi:hypothetical protein
VAPVNDRKEPTLIVFRDSGAEQAVRRQSAKRKQVILFIEQHFTGFT